MTCTPHLPVRPAAAEKVSFCVSTGSAISRQRAAPGSRTWTVMPDAFRFCWKKTTTLSRARVSVSGTVTV